jgi:hypothetical protein
VIHQNIIELKSIVKNKPIYLVGGGSSLKNFDWNFLKDKNHIAINAAYNFCPNATALYWADTPHFDNKNLSNLQKHNTQLRFTTTKNWLECFSKERNLSIAGGVLLHRQIEKDFTPNLHEICGNNSGAQCINFAINLGVSNIILLGYDMGGEHFHDFYDFRNYIPPDEHVYRSFSDSIIKMLPYIKQSNIPVVHGTKGSRLTCFPTEV